MSDEVRLFPQPTNWPSGWHPIDRPTEGGIESELKRELPQTHSLYGLEISAVAQRFDCDDVLFLVRSRPPALAWVHLTWRGTAETSATWPWTRVYQRFEDWAADQPPEPE
jgi:hypothetical protein